jgi:hypothetical protein
MQESSVRREAGTVSADSTASSQISLQSRRLSTGVLSAFQVRW